MSACVRAGELVGRWADMFAGERTRAWVNGCVQGRPGLRICHFLLGGFLAEMAESASGRPGPRIVPFLLSGLFVEIAKSASGRPGPRVEQNRPPPALGPE